MQWVVMINDPVNRTGMDFIHFFAAGQIAQRYGMSSVYDLNLQQKIEAEVVGFELVDGQVLPYNHMPYLIPLLKVVINSSYVESFVRWVLIALFGYITAGAVLVNSMFQNIKREEFFTLLGAVITFYPFAFSLVFGQDTAFLFLGVSLWCAGLLRKNTWLAAVGLALATIRPHICLMLAIPFLFRDQRLWWRFVLAALVLAMASLLILGQAGAKQFIDLIRITAGGDWFGTNQKSMLNLLGMTLRLFPFINENLVRIFAWVGYVTGIGVISMLWLQVKGNDEYLAGISVIAALFFAPHLHYHDVTLLILPLLLVVKLFLPQYPLYTLVTALLGISFALFLSMALGNTYLVMPYLLYVMLTWTIRQQLIEPARSG